MLNKKLLFIMFMLIWQKPLSREESSARSGSSSTITVNFRAYPRTSAAAGLPCCWFCSALYLPESISIPKSQNGAEPEPWFLSQDSPTLLHHLLLNIKKKGRFTPAHVLEYTFQSFDHIFTYVISFS